MILQPLPLWELHRAKTGCLARWSKTFLLLQQYVENVRFLKGAWAWLVLKGLQCLCSTAAETYIYLRITVWTLTSVSRSEQKNLLKFLLFWYLGRDNNTSKTFSLCFPGRNEKVILTRTNTSEPLNTGLSVEVFIMAAEPWSEAEPNWMYRIDLPIQPRNMTPCTDCSAALSACLPPPSPWGWEVGDPQRSCCGIPWVPWDRNQCGGPGPVPGCLCAPSRPTAACWI